MSVFFHVTDFNIFSETNKSNRKNLYRNATLVDLIRFYDFGANPKFNMATKANNAIWLAGLESSIF